MTNKDDMQIMVVSAEELFRNGYFQGFSPHHNRIDYEQRILEKLFYIRRGDAEEKPGLKQPIAYCLIVNYGLQKVFAYQRSKLDERYPEKRLQGKWSWGIGGHIEMPDNTESRNPIHESMLREIQEEVEIMGSVSLSVLGYINDDADEIGRVHFGILYAVVTNTEVVNPKDPEIDNGRYRTIQELEELCSNVKVEGWSKIALEPLRELMSKNLSNIWR